MKRLLYCCLALLLLGGCAKKEEKKIDWHVTLNKESKEPYGTWLAYHSLPQYFPTAHIEPLNRFFRYTSIDEQMRYHPDSPALLLMAGLDDYMTEEEWEKITTFARAGNEVMIFASRLDNVSEKALHCHKYGSAEEYPLSFYNDGKSNANTLSLLPDTSKRYGYEGRYITGYFTVIDSAAKPSAATIDTTSIESYTSSDESTDDDYPKKEYGIDSIPEVLGRNPKYANFIRYKAGHGHITLHAAPLVLSNYFLLQGNNRAYLDGIWHTLPANISVIYWNEYFRRSTGGNTLAVLFKYPPMKWGLILAVITLLLYVLFSLKPLQRKIAIIRPHQNASVSFVETIGRLYYNKGAHANLAEKMIQHFLEWVRTNYYLNTSQLNDAFAERLAAKSGKPIEQVNELLRMIHDIRLGGHVDSEYLYRIYDAIQSYYH